jgi:hypothetical protein
MSTASGEFDTRSSEEPEQPQKRIRLSPETSPAESEGEIDSSAKRDSATSSPEKEDSYAPPLPDEAPPPLPNEPLPAEKKDDGWDPVWDDTAQAFYFYNRFTAVSQWENPRVPEASQSTTAPGLANHDRIAPASNGDTQTPPSSSRPAGSYDPAIHGDYDPTAPYAQPDPTTSSAALDPRATTEDPNMIYTATGAFNRFTGKWQAAGLTPDNFNDENKSKRQMNAFFDVDAAANSHDGKSLKAERSGKKLTKKEVKAFKDKRREKKEEKRRAWLRD